MVEFIYGIPGSGKTAYIMSRLLSDAEHGRRAFLIVPEQQTVDVERELAERLPAASQMYIEALNFSRLANRVFRERGGLVYNYADKSRKLLFMWRAIREAAPLLSEYGDRAAQDPSLPLAMLTAVKEFKACGIHPETLRETANRFSLRENETGALGRKLGDLAVIYSTYSALLGERFADSADDPDRLSALLEESGDYFCGASIYIDSFSGFTGQEHRVIKLIMRQADEVVITLPAASPSDRSLAALSSHKCSSRLRRDASALGITPELITLGENKRAKNAELRAATDYAAESAVAHPVPDEERGHIELLALADPYSECDIVSARIKELIMSGYRCRDIAIIAGDAEKYRGMIDVSLKKNGIPCFLSEKTGFSSRPLAGAILSALRIKLYGWRRADVIAHLKTGLCGIPARDIDIFEAYIEKWNINGSSFYSDTDWSMDPDGYSARMSRRGKETLECANRVRRTLRDRLTLLFASIDAANSTIEVCRAVWRYMQSCEMRETLRSYAARALAEGDRREADELLRLYDSAIDAMECVCDVFTEKPTTDIFCAALRLAFDAAELGSIPTGCDEVMIGSANMLRAGERKCAVLIGMTDGEFPKNSAGGGLLTDRDRRFLAETELVLDSDAETFASDEQHFLLRAISVPSERLVLSTHLTDASGSSCLPSSAFLRFKLMFPYIKVRTEKDITPIDRIWSRAGALEYLSLCRGTTVGKALEGYISDSPEDAHILRAARLPLTSEKDRISASVARGAFGDTVDLTQTKLEAYLNCPYGYYMRFILRLHDDERAELDYSIMGTYVHHVLERFLSATASDIIAGARPNETRTAALLDDITTKYIESLGSAADNARTKHTIERLKKGSRILLSDIFDEFASGSFRPAALELPIGDLGGVPAPRFPLRDGSTAILRGKIDRVDTTRSSEGETLIRVVDYKTGKKDFSFEGFKNGFGMQMPLYLYALTGGRYAARNDSFGPRPVPAAITYISADLKTLPLDRYRSADETASLIRRSIKRSGLVLEREDVFKALSADGDTHFMQGVKYTKSGAPSSAIVNADGMRSLFDTLEETVTRIATEMRGGKACAVPHKEPDGSAVCNYCPYSSVCRNACKKKET